MTSAPLATLKELKDRVVELDDQAFIEDLVSQNHQEVYWSGWVQLYTKSNAAAKKERVLVITNFRLLTIKHGVMGRSARQSFNFYDLEELKSPPNSTTDLHLSFAGGHEMDIQSEVAIDVARAIMFGVRSISYGLPQNMLPKIILGKEFFDGWVSPVPDTQDGLLAIYLAMCDYISVSAKLPVLDYFMSSFEAQDNVFDLDDCLHSVDKVTEGDFIALAAALRSTNWFDEVAGVNFPIKDDGLAALSEIFSFSDNVSRLILINVSAKKGGFTALAKHLSSAKHGLRYVNVSRNNIGDSGVKSLVDALGTTPRVPHTLSIQACGFSSKGYTGMMETLCTEAWLEQLRILDVSENSAGKSGTQALCAFLSKSKSLEQLYCIRSDVQMEPFLAALAENKELCENKLTTINVSGNKLKESSTTALANILRSSKSITHVYLVDCISKGSAKTCVHEILKAVLENKHEPRYWLELSNTEIGPKGAKEISELFASHKESRNIHALILNNTALGGEGVSLVVSALSGFPVHTLGLDCNMKMGLMSGKAVTQACEAVAQFVNTTPTLREFSIAGDDNHSLRQAAFPILEALKTNKSLRHLDISRNKLGDEGIQILANALSTNRTLTSFNAERNKMGIKGLRDLHAAVAKNTALTDWTIPRADIEVIHKNAGIKAVKEMRAIMVDFDQIMDRNMEAMALRLQEEKSAEPRGDAKATEVQLVDADTLSVPERDTVRSIYRRKRASRTASEMFDSLQEDSKEKSMTATIEEADSDLENQSDDEQQESNKKTDAEDEEKKEPTAEE